MCLFTSIYIYLYLSIYIHLYIFIIYIYIYLIYIQLYLYLSIYIYLYVSIYLYLSIYLLYVKVPEQGSAGGGEVQEGKVHRRDRQGQYIYNVYVYIYIIYYIYYLYIYINPGEITKTTANKKLHMPCMRFFPLILDQFWSFYVVFAAVRRFWPLTRMPTFSSYDIYIYIYIYIYICMLNSILLLNPISLHIC